MTNTYHNNGSGGTVFQPAPEPPVDALDRPPEREVSADV
jgi:hypothetical protein